MIGPAGIEPPTGARMPPSLLNILQDKGRGISVVLKQYTGKHRNILKNPQIVWLLKLVEVF